MLSRQVAEFALGQLQLAETKIFVNHVPQFYFCSENNGFSSRLVFAFACLCNHHKLNGDALIFWATCAELEPRSACLTTFATGMVANLPKL